MVDISIAMLVYRSIYFISFFPQSLVKSWNMMIHSSFMQKTRKAVVFKKTQIGRGSIILELRPNRQPATCEKKTQTGGFYDCVFTCLKLCFFFGVHGKALQGLQCMSLKQSGYILCCLFKHWTSPSKRLKMMIWCSNLLICIFIWYVINLHLIYQHHLIRCVLKRCIQVMFSYNRRIYNDSHDTPPEEVSASV